MSASTKLTVADKLTIVRDYLAKKNEVEIDRFGNIKFTDVRGKLKRYKFKKLVIRYETRVGEKGAYQWVNIRSYSVTAAYDALVKKELI